MTKQAEITATELSLDALDATSGAGVIIHDVGVRHAYGHVSQAYPPGPTAAASPRGAIGPEF